MELDKILVPLDGSRLSEAALKPAIDLAREHSGATIVLMRAVEVPTLPGVDPTEAQVAVVSEAETYLDRVAARLAEAGISRVKTSVWYGPPAPSIIEAAQTGRVGILVMSTHGRSGLGRLILGSVAESVVRGTRTPILLVRDEGAPVAPPATPEKAPTEATRV